MKQNEYIKMVNEAKAHSYRYYVLSAPVISDQEFDALVDRISEAENDHPEWTLADSPTQCVGSDVSNNGRRLIRHRTRMLSCQKAQTTEAVMKWISATEKKLNKQNDVHYVLEWKLDGISCSLVYQDGTLVSAATRGEKGIMGQDLTDHVALMPSVPKNIIADGRIEVRGEIVCKKENLPLLGYKDCRTAASSLCNQVVPSADCRLLNFVAWQLDNEDNPIGTETVCIDEAERLGFETSGRVGCWADNIIARLGEFEQKRETLPYPTDGVVIKIDCKPIATSLGCTEHHPKSSIAYKFCAQKAITRCKRVEISVGATGRRTPVAYVEPVIVMGREIKQVSLGSERKMRELSVTAGCEVEVGLSNDVTPKIYRVVKGNLTTENAPHTAPCNEIQEIVDARTDEVEENDAAWKKVAFGAAAAVVALVAINTLGLFGMAAAGLLVGGLIK